MNGLPQDDETWRSIPQELTILDWIGAAVAGMSALALFVFPIASRSFAGMFRDLGSGDHLPLLTKASISTWFPIILGAIVSASLVCGFRPAVPLPRRRAWVVGAFLLGCAGFGLCVVGLYLPIFSVAGAVRAD